MPNLLRPDKLSSKGMHTQASHHVVAPSATPWGEDFVRLPPDTLIAMRSLDPARLASRAEWQQDKLSQGKQAPRAAFRQLARVCRRCLSTFSPRKLSGDECRLHTISLSLNFLCSSILDLVAPNPKRWIWTLIATMANLDVLQKPLSLAYAAYRGGGFHQRLP
jgi:hypothetical protein